MVEIEALPRYTNNLLQNISTIDGKKILIIGDIGIDQYITGKVRRISPEGPVPVVEVSNEKLGLGMAANVALNVKEMGGEPMLVGVIGKDHGAENLGRLMQESKIAPDFLIVDKQRPTTQKVRVMAGPHPICRIDYEKKEFLDKSVSKKLTDEIDQLIPECHGVIIQDYAKGVFSEGICQHVIETAGLMNKPTFVDPYHSTPIEYYRGCDVLKGNFKESISLSGVFYDDLRNKPDLIPEVAGILKDKLNIANVVVTRGSEGMTLFEGEEMMELPTYARQVYDVTGAGDAVIATLALAYVSGFTLQEAGVLANYAAGVVVGKLGCLPCSRAEVLHYIQNRVSD